LSGEEAFMKKIFICCFVLLAVNSAYALGDWDTSKINELYNTNGAKSIEGLSEGYQLFIDVILEMQWAEDKNYDLEHIVNTYLPKINDDTNYDWIKFITSEYVAATQVRYTTFFNLLEIYVSRQKEHLLFNNDFYKGVIVSLDEYKNGKFDIQEESQVENRYYHIIDKMYSIKTDNYTIVFEYDFDSARPPKQTIRKRVVVDKKSNTTYFDHYIGSAREAIVALGDKNFSYYTRRDDAWRLFSRDYYIEFYFDENDMVNKIEYGDN
jgi:hypothetical protein